MKATVILADPEERFTVDIDGRDRRKFEKNMRHLGLTPGPVQDIAKQHPETYVAALAYYAMYRTSQWTGDYESFDARLVEIVDISGGEDVTANPTKSAP